MYDSKKSGLLVESEGYFGDVPYFMAIRRLSASHCPTSSTSCIFEAKKRKEYRYILHQFSAQLGISHRVH